MEEGKSLKKYKAYIRYVNNEITIQELIEEIKSIRYPTILEKFKKVISNER